MKKSYLDTWERQTYTWEYVPNILNIEGDESGWQIDLRNSWLI